MGHQNPKFMQAESTNCPDLQVHTLVRLQAADNLEQVVRVGITTPTEQSHQPPGDLCVISPSFRNLTVAFT